MDKIYKFFFREAKKENFRTDIQALRAIAVLSVVLYHFWPEQLPGGFIGVDIFFVISGYLMTLTIWKSIRAEMVEGHLFRKIPNILYRFYAKRIKRLAPASILVLLFSLVSVAYFGSIQIKQRTSVQIFQSSIFMQNWFLADQSVDYLGQDDSATMVQHFWSLSLEEQFYMIWPILLIIVALIAIIGSKVFSLKPRIGYLIVISIFTIGFFIYGFNLSYSDPSFAYFTTPARLWELSLGGILVFIPKLKPKVASYILAWVGFATCIFAIIFMDGANFPGWRALFPVLGTALAIYAENSGKFSLSDFSKFRPLQFFGDISYSFYLWHWPFIVLYPIIFKVTLGETEKLYVLGISILVAWFSYRFIESILQKVGLKDLWIYFVSIFCLGYLLFFSSQLNELVNTQAQPDFEQLKYLVTDNNELCVGAKAIGNPGFCSNPYGEINQTYAQYGSNAEINWSLKKNGTRCGGNYHPFDNADFKETCVVGAESPKNDIKVAVVGDSHLQQYIGALDIAAQDLDIKVDLLISVQCDGGVGLINEANHKDNSVEKHYSNRAAKCNQRFEYIKSEYLDKADVIIISNSGPNMQSHFKGVNETLLNTEKLIQFANETHKKIYIIEDLRQDNIIECNLVNTCNTVKAVSYKPIYEYYQKIDADGYKDKYGLINTEKLFCDAETCYDFIGGVPVFLNKGHINSIYSFSVGPWMKEQLQAAIAR